MSKVKKRNKFQRSSLYALNSLRIRYVPLISRFYHQFIILLFVLYQKRI